MSRMKWLNLVLASLLAVAPLQMAFAQSGSPAHAAMAMHVEGAKNMHTAHQHVAAVPVQQESGQPCGQHKGPCLACGLCGAHCAATLMSYEFSALIGHLAVAATPPLLAAILSPPPPGEPPRLFHS